MDYERAFKFLELYAPNALHLANKIAKRCVEDDHSWFWLDPAALDTHDKRPTILLYSSCHVNQLRLYFQQHHKDVLERYKINAVLCHQLQLDFDPADREVIDGLFAKADLFFVNILPDKFGFTATSNFIKHRKPDSFVYTFVPPTFAAYWPVTCPFGEDGVIAHMNDGLDENQIVGLFHRGAFDPKFDVRFPEQIANLALREGERHVKLSQFIVDHKRSIKTFFSSNHPSYHTIAYIGQRLLEEAGLAKLNLDLVRTVDTNAAHWGSFFPESEYEFGYYDFTYPIRWPNDRGGSKFYEAQIRESFAKQTALRARGEKEYCNPEDDL